MGHLPWHSDDFELLAAVGAIMMDAQPSLQKNFVDYDAIDQWLSSHAVPIYDGLDAEWGTNESNALFRARFPTIVLLKRLAANEGIDSAAHGIIARRIYDAPLMPLGAQLAIFVFEQLSGPADGGEGADDRWTLGAARCRAPLATSSGDGDKKRIIARSRSHGRCPQAEGASAQPLRKKSGLSPWFQKSLTGRREYQTTMGSYTLILSRGTYVVDAAAGEAILVALLNNDPIVTVDADMMCDGFVRRNVRLSTSHVIAVIPNLTDEAESDEISFGPNVTQFRPLRQAR